MFRRGYKWFCIWFYEIFLNIFANAHEYLELKERILSGDCSTRIFIFTSPKSKKGF